LNKFIHVNIGGLKIGHFKPLRELLKLGISPEEIAKKSKAACQLFLWAMNVEELYKMCFTVEF
jgi:hypothetical protein